MYLWEYLESLIWSLGRQGIYSFQNFVSEITVTICFKILDIAEKVNFQVFPKYPLGYSKLLSQDAWQHAKK